LAFIACWQKVNDENNMKDKVIVVGFFIIISL